MIHRRLLGEGEGPAPRLQTMRGGARMLLDTRDRTEAEAFVTRRWEAALVDLVRRRLPARGGVLFDVGAHVGLVAFQVAAYRAAQGVSICSFEPNPSAVARFRRNLVLNPGADVELIQAAAGAEAGGTAAIALDPAAGDLASAHVQAPGEATGGALTAEVAVTTIDREASERGLGSVDVLKLDVEGFELEALRGARDLLSSKSVGCVICELNDVRLEARGVDREAVRDQLREWGYRERELPAVGLQRRSRHRSDKSIVDVVFEP